MCSPPFDRSPSRCSHRWFEPIFSIFQASTLFSFYLSCHSMAEPRVLVLGDSFIRRVRLFLSRDSYHFSVDFKRWFHRAFIKWYGVGGCTVSKTLHLDLNVIESFRPEIVILQLGSNDLTDSDPLHVGSALEDFVRLLHDTYELRLSACARPSCARAQWSLIVRPSC